MNVIADENAIQREIVRDEFDRIVAVREAFPAGTFLMTEGQLEATVRQRLEEYASELEVSLQVTMADHDTELVGDVSRKVSAAVAEQLNAQWTERLNEAYRQGVAAVAEHDGDWEAALAAAPTFMLAAGDDGPTPSE